MALNLFGPPTKDDIKVAYIDPILGLVEGVSICEANEYAKREPGTTFIFRNGNQTLQYLNVNEINQLDPNVLITTDECGGISQKKECGPPTIQIFGGGGIGAAGNPIVGNDGAILAVDIIRGGNGYQYPPLVSARDICNYGSGATFTTVIGEVVETTETYDNEADFEDYELCDPTDVGYGQNWGPDGEDLGPWDPRVYTNPGEDPIRKEIAEYQTLIRRLARTPFWSTRTAKPTKIVCSDARIIPSKYDVTYWNWGGRVIKTNPVETTAPTISETQEVSFSVFGQGGKGVTGYLFTFTSADGQHIFTLNGAQKSKATRVEKIQIRKNVNYDVVASHIDGRLLEQGIIKEGTKKREGGLDQSNKIFADGVKTNNDNDDIQITLPSGGGIFKSLNRTKVSGRSTFDITYVLEGSSTSAPKPSTTQTITPEVIINDTFMNKYAISPVSPSNVPGSDFAGRVFTFEWTENFPTDGEYIFKGICDNKAQLYIDNLKIADIQQFPIDLIGKDFVNGVLEGYDVGFGLVSKTLTKGIHNIRVDLLNVGIPETVLKPPKTVEIPFGSFFLKEGDSYYILIGGNDVVEIDFVFDWADDANFGYAVTKITIPTETGGPVVLSRPLSGTVGSSKATGSFRADKKYGPIIFEGTSSRFKDTYITDSGPAPEQKNQIIAFFDDDPDDLITNAQLVAVNARQLSPGRIVNEPLTLPDLKVKKVFNTVDYIGRANRTLWRTNFVANNSFISESGVCPFDTSIALLDNPYAGTHTIVWPNVNFPVDGSYRIKIAVDDSVTLFIGDQQIRYEGFITGTSIANRGFNESRVFKAGNYTIRAELEQIPGGVFAFSGVNPNPMALAIDIETTTITETIISSKSWNDNPMGLALTIDAPAAPPPPQEQPPEQEGRCPNNPIWTTRFPGAKEFWYPVNYRGERKQETLSTVSVDKPFGSIFLKEGDNYYILIGGNDIIEIDFVFNWFDSADFGYALTKITIPTETGGPVVLSRPLEGTTGSSKGTGTFKADGKYGPIIFDGVASRGQIIDSGPAPGQRQQIIEFFDNEVNDLISNANLHAVNARQLSQPKENIIPSITVTSGWSKFLNRYAISPVRPLDTPGSDGGGSLFTNSWDIDIPYDGFYKFVAEQDDYGKIYLDGQIINLSKVFITRGRHTIGVELENRKTEAFDQIPQKIFRTLDWHVAASNQEYVEVDFSVFGQGGRGVTGYSFTFTSVDGKDTFTLRGAQRSKETRVEKIKLRPNVDYNVVASHADSRLLEQGIIKQGTKKKEGGVGQSNKIFADGVKTANDNDDIQITISQGNFTASNFRKIGGRSNYDLIYKLSGEDISTSITGGVTSGTVKGGVTYIGPSIFHYQDNRWGSYMNKNSISPVIPGDSADASGRKQFIWRGVNFPESGQYDVQFLADTNAGLIIGGTRVLSSQGFAENPQTFKVNITQGTYDITVDSEYPYNSLETNNTQYFRDINPTGFALEIRKNISVLREGSGKSWKENPMGIGAILIPPPCPRRIRGKGVVTDVIVNDPGNGYLPPIAPTITPPSTLALIQTNVPGVPGSGAGAGAGGGTGAPGGLPGVPAVPLSIPSPPSGAPTGINASFRPQFEVVRDPVVIDPQKLLQVTDLVGLKQTGYVNGRAYYGAVYYDKGIRYAGFYETVGEPIQVYDTLRESILAQVITPPSAILRQGTDIRSSNPLLNIPGTVQSTLSSNSIVGAGDIFPPSVPFVPEPVSDPIYPVSLRLKRVLVEDPGINYNVTDQIRVIPSNGAILEPVFGSFGRIIKVAVIDPGFGFTEYPRIEMFTPL
jgi:hypothetical protein